MNYKSLTIILSFFLITFGVSQAFSFATAQETTKTDTSRTDTSRTPIPERTPPSRELSPESLPITFGMLESVVYSIFDIPYFLTDLFSEIVGDVCASLLPSLWDAVNALGGVSGLVGVAVGIFNLIFGGVWEIAQSLGITVAAALGAGIVGLILGVVNLAFNVINFIYATGVGGVSIMAIILSIINMAATAMLAVLVIALFIGEIILGLLSIVSLTFFTWIPLLISGVISPIFSIVIIIMKVQQLAMAGISFPFGFASLVTIFSGLFQLVIALIPWALSWAGILLYIPAFLLSFLFYIPIVGSLVGMFILPILAFIAVLAIGIIFAIIAGFIGFIFELILDIAFLVILIISILLIVALNMILVPIGVGLILILIEITIVAVLIAALFILSLVLVAGAVLGIIGLAGVIGIILGIAIFIFSFLFMFLGPLLGLLVQLIVLPLAFAIGVFGITVISGLIDFVWILLENIFSFVTMIVNFIGIFILQIFLQTIETITISEIVSVIVLFTNRIAESVPFGNVIGGILQALVGVGMLLLAGLFAVLNIVMYPFNLCYTMGVRFCASVLNNVPVLDLRNWIRRPLGWS